MPDWEPHPAAPGHDRWTGDDRNARVHVGLLRHGDGPRPWMVLIHGAEMGRPEVDARMFRAQRIHEELGVDVAMPVLPRHGPRASESLRRAAVHGSGATWDHTFRRRSS